MATHRDGEAGLVPVHAAIARHYSTTVARHGPTPRGADWACAPTQRLRFVQLLKVCDFSTPISLVDLGCGYGALLEYLDKRHAGTEIDYLGVDLSPAMLRHARRLWRGRRGARFVLGHASPEAADYTVASGIFNVKNDVPRPDWERFVAHTLGEMHATSRRGFAVNLLAPPRAGRGGSPSLYDAPVGRWAAYCEEELGVVVEVIEGYGMCEYTLLARSRSFTSSGR
jgi:SAM-dependent methyltransferase